MGKLQLFCLAWALAWISGVIFGMGLERKLFERKNCNIQTEKSNDCAPEPLPMTKIETNNGTGDLGRPVILGIEIRHDDK